MVSSIPTHITNFVQTTANYVKQGVMRNKVTRRVSVLAASGAAILTANKIYHSPKAAEVCSAVSHYANTVALPFLRERVIPYFYVYHRFTRFSVGIVAGVATVVAVVAYTRLRKIKRELRQAQVQIANLQQQVTDHPAQMNAVRERMTTEGRTLREELEQRIQNQQGHITQLEQRIQNQQGHITRLEQRIHDQTAQQAEVQHLLVNTQHALAALEQTHGQDVARHEELEEQLRMQQAALMVQAETNATARLTLEQRLQESQQEMTHLKNAHLKERQDLHQQIQGHCTKIEEIETTRGQLSQQLDAAGQEITSLQENFRKAQFVIKNQATTLDKLELKVTNAKQSQGFAEKALAQRQAELEQLRQELETLQASKPHVNLKRLQALEEENTRLKNSQNADANLVPHLKRQIEVLTQTSTHTQNQLKDDNQSLRNELLAVRASQQATLPRPRRLSMEGAESLNPVARAARRSSLEVFSALPLAPGSQTAALAQRFENGGPLAEIQNVEQPQQLEQAQPAPQTPTRAPQSAKPHSSGRNRRNRKG